MLLHPVLKASVPPCSKSGRVGKLWYWCAESFIEQNLLGSIGNVVFPDHMSDFHINVIDQQPL